jgi:hypothetical protein
LIKKKWTKNKNQSKTAEEIQKIFDELEEYYYTKKKEERKNEETRLEK